MSCRWCTGSLLVITLWLMTILSVLAVAIARYLSLEVRLTKYSMAHEQAEALARSGVYLAMQQLSFDAPEGVDWREDDWAFTNEAPWRIPRTTQGPGPIEQRDHVELVITDEERRLNLNDTGTTDILLTTLLGVPEAAQAIMDYRDPLDPAEDQPDVPYFAKDAGIKAMEELLDIPVLVELRQSQQSQPQALSTLQQETTVYTTGAVNANTASEQVLLAVKQEAIAQGQVAAGLIQLFAERRGVGSDQLLDTADDCLMTNDASALLRLENCLGTGPAEVQNLVAGLAHESAVFRIAATGVTRRPTVRVRVEAVIKRGSCGANVSDPCIVAWRQGG